MSRGDDSSVLSSAKSKFFGSQDVIALEDELAMITRDSFELDLLQIDTTQSRTCGDMAICPTLELLAASSYTSA